jgi:phosphopantetheinyl transferase
MSTQLFGPRHVPVIWIWVLRLDLPVPASTQLEDLLDIGERRRAYFIREEERRQRFIFLKAARRLILGRALRKSPADVTVIYGLKGNPMFTQAGHYLSFADSNNVALVGLCNGSPVGVDLEAVIDDAACEEIASLYAPAERAWLQSSPSHLRPERVTKLWCRKEAVGKARGHGLEAALAEDVSGTSVGSYADGRWTVYDFYPANGYHACVALPAPRAAIRIEHLETWDSLWLGNSVLPPDDGNCKGEIDVLAC